MEGLKPAPTAMAKTASAPREYMILRSISSLLSSVAVEAYFGLYRAPAASANVASAAAVNSRCFKLLNFARIHTPPRYCPRSLAHDTRSRHRSS